ncbi:uncharacterized protein EV422DRAFT_531754 [Fimicolochytrium jonesii]|uniref:uncharacterized protein n=1 Tax=Fimicolochytrium jonesii TaxID=1396493 RepID=UPI0022FDD5B0|nr:uncharacterized protein EV422DRAFT_531754 [Fimicolochytrium jonesii]KAI8820128.1 hypothetical protein EV422DRAFT_531754 [Fimicolochytrium jonesii]
MAQATAAGTSIAQGGSNGTPNATLNGSGVSIPADRANLNANGLGTTPSQPPPPSVAAPPTAPAPAATPSAYSENIIYKPPTTMREYARHFKRLAPFIWPKGNDTEALRLKLLILACFALIVLGRIINLLVPLQFKRVIDALGDVSGVTSHGGRVGYATAGDDETVTRPPLPYVEILIYVFLKFLAGGGGVLSILQSYIWVPVGQFTTRELSIKMFEHLHNLSLRFHLNRKTGEILRVQDRGVSSIVSLFSSILFNVVPTLADIGIGCFYFALAFDIYFGAIVFSTMGLYIYFTIVITEWRTHYRRIANMLDNAMEAKAVDSLLNFETVKYYNAEPYEVNRFTDAVIEYQKADYKSNIVLFTLNTAQNILIQVGMIVGSLVCAKRIVYDHTMTVGDFVLYLSYITQLYGPLNWFGNHYRVIQKNFVDMEKMLDLFKEPVDISDPPNPKHLPNKGGEVVFDNVSFSYDARRGPVLDGISFTAAPGSTVALVGPSGSGKSTVLRLLFRFYDVQAGSIRIDGVDIRDVRQGELRSVIGVVPQDTVLFNESLRYNLMYGRPGAREEEMVAATEAAQIHERILGFADGYNTKVGERGLRLSGGEKQRIAIARTLLKHPSIILLDEATSALDSRSEAAVQSALLSSSTRSTTIVIAHRLSTIVNADMILVVKDGQIVERGNHDTLMRMRDGVYFDMWMKQLRDERGMGGVRGLERVVGWLESAGGAENGPAGGAGSSAGEADPDRDDGASEPAHGEEEDDHGYCEGDESVSQQGADETDKRIPSSSRGNTSNLHIPPDLRIIPASVPDHDTTLLSKPRSSSSHRQPSPTKSATPATTQTHSTHHTHMPSLSRLLQRDREDNFPLSSAARDSSVSEASLTGRGGDEGSVDAGEVRFEEADAGERDVFGDDGESDVLGPSASASQADGGEDVNEAAGATGKKKRRKKGKKRG